MKQPLAVAVFLHKHPMGCDARPNDARMAIRNAAEAFHAGATLACMHCWRVRVDPMRADTIAIIDDRERSKELTAVMD